MLSKGASIGLELCERSERTKAKRHDLLLRVSEASEQHVTSNLLESSKTLHAIERRLNRSWALRAKRTIQSESPRSIAASERNERASSTSRLLESFETWFAFKMHQKFPTVELELCERSERSKTKRPSLLKRGLRRKRKKQAREKCCPRQQKKKVYASY